jgi:hypothetical protein
MTTVKNDAFAAYVAQCERKLVRVRLGELQLEKASSWRDREIRDLEIYLLEVDDMIARHQGPRRQ